MVKAHCFMNCPVVRVWQKMGLRLVQIRLKFVQGLSQGCEKVPFLLSSIFLVIGTKYPPDLPLRWNTRLFFQLKSHVRLWLKNYSSLVCFNLPAEHIFNLLIGPTIILFAEVVAPRVCAHKNFGLGFVQLFNFVQFWRRLRPFRRSWYPPESATVWTLEVCCQGRQVALRYKALEAFELHSEVEILTLFAG